MIVLDRFEGDYAILEIDEQIVDVKKDLLKGNIKEGDVLVLIDGVYYKDEEGTKKRKEYMAARFSKLWKK